MANEYPNGRARLTDLEVAVITTLAEGVTDIETAARLYVYETTVRRVLRSAIRKWGANDRAHLLSLWANAKSRPVADSYVPHS